MFRASVRGPVTLHEIFLLDLLLLSALVALSGYTKILGHIYRASAGPRVLIQDRTSIVRSTALCAHGGQILERHSHSYRSYNRLQDGKLQAPRPLRHFLAFAAPPLRT
jgi:hypothetical protein